MEGTELGRWRVTELGIPTGFRVSIPAEYRRGIYLQGTLASTGDRRGIPAEYSLQARYTYTDYRVPARYSAVYL